MADELFGNIYDIQKFSVHDGPGIRTDIFLKGCPLKCLWCHSPESQGFGPDVAWMDIRCIGFKYCALCRDACDRGAISESAPKKSLAGGEELTYPVIDRAKCDVCLKCVEACPSTALYDPLRKVTVEDCMRSIRQDKKYYDKSGGGVTISGGEPMSQFEFTLALSKACKAEGFTVALDTTGYAPTERFMEILPYVDLFLYDLKHMDCERHKKLTGVGNELILKNAKALAEAGGRFQIRFPIIPKLNDGPENIRATAEFCRSIRDAIDTVQLLPYHKMGSMKYARLGKKYRLVNVQAPSNEFMEEQLRLFEGYGLKAMIH